MGRRPWPWGLLVLSGCAVSAHRSSRNEDATLWEGRGRECVRAFVSRDSPYHQRIDDGLAEEALAAVPPEARRTARAAGLERLMVRLLEGAPSATMPSVESVALRQELSLRLISLETQLAAVIFEAECTGEMIESVAAELERRSQGRDFVLALSSLAIGAAAATTAGIWDLANGSSNGPAVTGLAGGTASTAIAAAAFVPRTELTTYPHAHNLLAPILHGEDPQEMYPAFVFRLLTLEGVDAAPSPRDALLAEWERLIANAVAPEGRAATRALLFGPGGRYDQDAIALRERLYDALETKLNALARDLELLDRFLVRALEAPSPATRAP